MDDSTGISLYQGGGINVENAQENQEEVEDLEDQKRRQAEIQNLLTKVMDEFNYDEQSTINSSTNVSIDESMYNNTEQKYKNASYDDQLKVLYEVRVREVHSLTEQLEKLRTELAEEKKTSTRKMLLLEAENERTRISLKQSQALAVSKTDEIATIQSELSRLDSNLKRSEEVLKKVNEEKDSCENLNKDLLNQLSVMHTGISTNTISNRQMHEKYEAEVLQLRTMLDTAQMKIERKEKECEELQQNFKDKCNEKDAVTAEKSSIINILTENLENAQQQCQELLQLIEKISQENKSMKLATSRNEMTDSIRIMGLADKTEIVKALQKELERTRDVQHKQQIEFEKLQATCVQLSENYGAAEHRIKQYKSEIACWTIENKGLENNLIKCNAELQRITEQLTQYRDAYVEKESTQKCEETDNVIQIPEEKRTVEHSVQVSEIFDTRYKTQIEESEGLKHDLEAAMREVETLKRQLSDADDQISKLSTTVSLEKERDKLIRTLQEKAAQFEKVITEKHNKPESTSVGINTENNLDKDQQSSKYEILQEKYEADLIQKEIQLRIELQNTYDAKLARLEGEFSKNITQHVENGRCAQCNELSRGMKSQELLIGSRNEELNFLKHQRQQDRDAVATLLEDWRDKLQRLESENKDVSTKYLEMKNYGDQLALKLKAREDGDNKLYAVIKRECEETIKVWNKQIESCLTNYNTSQRSKLSEMQKRIDDCTSYYDKEVNEIEMQFLQRKKAMEKSRTK